VSKEKWVVDASAVLAAIQDEQGGEYVKKQIDRCIISSVNWSEVLQKLSSSGSDVDKIDASLNALGLRVIDFTEDDGRISASLWPSCKSLGLSLADRACIATGLRLKTKIITADRAWKKLDIKSQLQLIR
jgi:PIN domain nuclease of toxin-antitoxin system